MFIFCHKSEKLEVESNMQKNYSVTHSLRTSETTQRLTPLIPWLFLSFSCNVRLSSTKLSNLSHDYAGADPGFLKGGVQIRSTSKKGGARRGSNFGPNVKKPTSWHKRGVQTPWTPPPPRSAHAMDYGLDCLLLGRTNVATPQF